MTRNTCGNVRAHISDKFDVHRYVVYISLFMTRHYRKICLDLSDPIVIFLCKLLNLQRLGFQYLMPVSMITLLLVSSTTGFEFSHIIMIFHCVPTHMLVLWPNEVRLWGRSIDGVKRCQIFRNIWQHGIWQRSIWQRSIWQRSVWQGRLAKPSNIFNSSKLALHRLFPFGNR